MALQIRYAQFDKLDLIWYLISALCFLLLVYFEKKKFPSWPHLHLLEQVANQLLFQAQRGKYTCVYICKEPLQVEGKYKVHLYI